MNIKRNIYRKVVDKFGRDGQLRMLQEECSELAVAVSHFIRGRDQLELIEEIADVEIMLEQVRTFFDGGRIDAIKDDKIQRLIARMRDAE